MIVGFSGWSGCGKDTAGAVLVELGWTRRAFADPIKAVATDIGWRGNKDPEGRELLQRLGVACREHLDPDVWIRPVLTDPPERLVITDVRFPNEAAAIKAAGGYVIRIERPGTLPVNGHLSETALDRWPFDLRVVNDDLDRFRSTIRTIGSRL